LISEGLGKCRESLALGRGRAATYDGRAIAVELPDDFEIAFGRSIIDAVAARPPGLRLVFRQTHSAERVSAPPRSLFLDARHVMHAPRQ